MKFKSDIEVQAGLRDGSDDIGTAGQLLSSTGTITNWIDQADVISAGATRVLIACKNTSGGTITKGTPVYQTGNVGATDVIEIAEADALISTGYLPAIGLLETDLINNAFGNVVITGELLNITTSPIDGVVPVTGDTIYLKSGGGLTLTKPTGEGNAIQNLGLVGKVSGGNAGSLTVASIMRQNDVPNLPEGRIWIGDGNTIVSDTIYVDEPNGRVGIGTTSPLGAIQIGDGAAASPSTNQIIVLSNIATTGGNSNLYLATGASGTSTIGMGSTQFSPTNTAGKIIYSDIVDTFSFNTNFSTKMVINGSGNVGIGTTNPGSKLQVDGEIDANGGDGYRINGKPWAAESSNNLRLGDCDGEGFSTSIYGSNSSEVMRVTGNNVGIGTTSPQAKLQVNGGVQLANDTAGASASKVGTFRYRTSGNNSYVDMCMQTGASTYAWVNIVTNSW